MAIDAYILPFPDGVMGFVDADPARLPVRRGRVTLALYGPAEATAADQAALRSRFIEALGSIVRSEGAYAAVFWPRLWWTVGGLLSLVLLSLVALPSGLSVVWLTFLAALLALPGGIGPLVRGWRARRLLRRLRRLHDVEVVPGRSRATADRMAALWTVAGRLRGSALDVLDQLESHSLEARWSGPARLYGHYRLWLEQGAALAPGLPGLWHRWRARFLGGAPPAPVIAVSLPPTDTR